MQAPFVPLPSLAPEFEHGRRTYCLLFVATAFVFVPVLFAPYPFGAFSLISPACFPAALALFSHDGARLEWIFRGLVTLSLLFYGALFYGFSRLVFKLSSEFSKSAGRLTFQALALLFLFACSFLRVIHCSYFVNDTGTYNFWEACVRAWAIY